MKWLPLWGGAETDRCGGRTGPARPDRSICLRGRRVVLGGGGGGNDFSSCEKFWRICCCCQNITEFVFGLLLLLNRRPARIKRCRCRFLQTTNTFVHFKCFISTFQQIIYKWWGDDGVTAVFRTTNYIFNRTSDFMRLWVNRTRSFNPEPGVLTRSFNPEQDIFLKAALSQHQIWKWKETVRYVTKFTWNIQT